VNEVVLAGGAYGYRVRRIGMAHPLAVPLPAGDVRPARVPVLGRAG
jgi:hypothetical protein